MIWIKYIKILGNQYKLLQLPKNFIFFPSTKKRITICGDYTYQFLYMTELPDYTKLSDFKNLSVSIPSNEYITQCIYLDAGDKRYNGSLSIEKLVSYPINEDIIWFG